MASFEFFQACNTSKQSNKSVFDFLMGFFPPRCLPLHVHDDFYIKCIKCIHERNEETFTAFVNEIACLSTGINLWGF